MKETNATLTTFDFGLPGEENDRESVFFKLYGKVKLAVVNHSDCDSGSMDSDFMEGLKATDENNSSSWYHCTLASQGALTDTSELSMVATSGFQEYPLTLPSSGSMDSIAASSSRSPQSLMNCSLSDLDYTLPHSRSSKSTFALATSSTKAPPIASVAITTATAIKRSPTSNSVDEMDNTTHSTKVCSNPLDRIGNNSDHVRFSPSVMEKGASSTETTGAPFAELANLGNNLMLPMTRSKSVDSDTQSIATTFSISNTNSLGKILARLRGQKSNKEFWMPDEQCKECYKCRKQFTMFRRKHHCRFCGQIFCSKCASHIIPGKSYNQKGHVRICSFCYTEQHLDNDSDTLGTSVTPKSRSLPAPSSNNYDLIDANINASDDHYLLEDTCTPVIPHQNPSLAAPMMQIPTTAVKKLSNTQYGDNNSTTVALEISDRAPVAILEDGLNHCRLSTVAPSVAPLSAKPLTELPCHAPSTPSASPHKGGSLITSDGLESLGLKRLIDAGTSILNSKHRPTISPSTSTDVSQHALQRMPFSSKVVNDGVQQGRYMDHGGGTAVAENELSPFLRGKELGDPLGQEEIILDRHRRDFNMISEKRHRSASVSCLPQSRPHSLQRSSILRHGQSSSTTHGKLAWDHLPSYAGNDNDVYDGNRWAKRVPESRGALGHLRRQSTTTAGTDNLGRKIRFGHLRVNTTGLTKPDSRMLDSGIRSPLPSHHYHHSSNGGKADGGDFYGMCSPLSPMPTATVASTSMASSPTLCSDEINGNATDPNQLTQEIKSNLPKIRNRRISTPSTSTELSHSAIVHAQKLLRQLIDETDLRDLNDNDKTQWEAVIMNLLLKITDHVQPDVRAGDEMDLRHYIKIKKIPGGRPSDSFYVKGVMCSKNVAHKRMVKNIAEPRILILLFSLDYSRVEMGNQLLSIKPVISQEREHINNLVGRIIALKPSLLLVKSTVSRLALEILLEAGIPVVHNVKYSVIEAVARCTQASVVTSVDKLQGDLFFGHCGYFEIRTFLHEWIPHRRKTLLVFGDCAPELGGTIVLRGGTESSLKTIKTVIDFMVFVVYNLKLETSLLRDSFAKNRGLEKYQIVTTGGTDSERDSSAKPLGDGPGNIPYINMGHLQPAQGSDALHAFLKVYQDTILSTSQYVAFPPPYLLTRLKETEDQLAEMTKDSSVSAPRHISYNSPITMSVACCALGLPSSDGSLRGDGSLSIPPQMLYPPSIITELRYELLEAQKHQLNCAWDAYLRESPDYVSPFYHQNIVVLYSNVCTVTTMPCYGPEIRVFEYYRYPSDMTLGQYLLDLFADALQPCPSAMCNYPVMDHYLSYAHGDARINVITQQFDCPISGMSDKLLMWSYCKICEKATQVTRVSESTWNYSFGKFLELSLYQQGVYCRADICPHEIGRHHVRFFGYMNLSVGFQYEPIDLLEVSAPSTKLLMLSQVQIDFKDGELQLLRTKIIDFYNSIIERNKAFPYDLVESQQLDECKAVLEDLSNRASGSKKKVLQILQNIYATTDKSDTLTINWVRRILYQEVADWDMEYSDMVRFYLLPERELLKITTSQLRKMFPVDTTNTSPKPTNYSDDFERSSMILGLSLLGISFDGGAGDLMMDTNFDGATSGSCMLDRPPSMLPQLFDSPTNTPGCYYGNQQQVLVADANNDHSDSDVLGLEAEPSSTQRSSSLRPKIWRQLSQELNRELQLRFRVSDSKDEQSQPTSYDNSQSRTPGPATAALTPSRIPIPNINITSTSRSLLSPPLYDSLGEGPITPRLILPPGRNKVPMAPLKVPSSLELNVTTPGLHLIPNKEQLAHRNLASKGRRLFGPSDLRICLPPAPGGSISPSQQQPAKISTPTFMQQKQRQPFGQYRSGLHTQNLQHIPSMFRAQYSNNDSGQHALGSIQRRSTTPVNNTNNNALNALGRPGSRQGQFKSRLPRRKTHIQVYTQANDLLKEDVDDEFLVSDLDDAVDLGVSNINGDEKQKPSSAGPKTPLILPMPKPTMDWNKLSEMNNNHNNIEEETIDYFSPQAPYTGTSGVSSSTTADQDRINQSVAAAMATVPRTPFSIQSIISATASNRSSSMLERLDTGPSTDSGTSTSLHENQLPSASDLLSSPAAISTSGNSASMTPTGAATHDKAGTGEHKSGGLPRNAFIERPTRRMVDLDEPKQVEKPSFVKTIANFLADAGTGNLLPLKNPLNSLEHVLPDSFVVVREDEPSTIIAYTLSCDDYLKKMNEMRDFVTDNNFLAQDTRTMEEPYDKVDHSKKGAAMENLSTGVDTEMTQTRIQDILLQEPGNHMRYHFSDGNTKFFCKTFYTEQFDALRRQCGCDQSYILSLASCIKWDAVGGKSGSAFLKTKDDRFLMKQMSRFELDAFLGFAPAYFQYLSKAFFTELPTVLAKIFGFYSIGYKNSSSGKSMRMDVLVMENLFYQRNVKKIFDLKGSMRNRHVESTGKEDEVLLDENLVELIFQSPLFIRAHSKDILRSSLHNDTLFLSGRNVMDYSLLVGIDEEREELIVGIVDFIRTFTWDKKLESWVKESVFLGPGVKEPTIVSPRQYRLRFRAAMERYFLMVPDVWALAKKNRLPCSHQEEY